MYDILTLNKIAKIGLDKLGTNYNVSDNVQNPDGILVRSAAMHDMQFGDNLKAIARAGAGTNNIPVERCAEEGIVVFNTPGANANAVKELVICGLFLASRDITEGVKWTSTLKNEGDAAAKLVEKGKGQFAGHEIAGKKIGVIGLGAIGVMVANAAHSLGMQVFGYDPYISVDAAWGLSRSIIHVNNINDIFAQCDYITIHVPLNPSTKYTINNETLALCKDGVRILNFSRNELVNNEALIAGLESGKVARYVTDFPSADLIDVKNIVCIPHLGASTEESEDNCAVMAAREIRDYLENGNISNSVNFPNCSAPREGVMRICVMHKNVPTMISQITNAVSAVNVDNMINKSKGDYAYTILDLSEEHEEAADSISSIDGVIRVRIIK
ncbi:MAG: 3-phosphoglycerate dehydrogenase [Clostridia bacterium]|nr:3-phosphoglycerate dehydrogenase [Clostridia bacterium]